VSSSSLTVNLYGTPQHRKVVTRTAPLTTTGPIPEKVEKDPTMLVGKRVVDHEGTPPMYTSVNRKVYDDSGKLLYDNTWYSSYVGDKSIIREGTKPKPKPTPKPADYLPGELVPGATTPTETTPTTTVPTSPIG
jgi:hypothetical protein